MPHAAHSPHIAVDVWLAAQVDVVPNAPVEHLGRLLEAIAARPPRVGALPYERTCLWQAGSSEVLVMSWTPNLPSAIHDHGGGRGNVFVLRGQLVEERWPDERSLRARADATRINRGAGSHFGVSEHVFHRMTNVGQEAALSVHVYHDVRRGMRLPDPIRGSTWLVPATHGAWLPARDTACEEERWR